MIRNARRRSRRVALSFCFIATCSLCTQSARLEPAAFLLYQSEHFGSPAPARRHLKERLAVFLSF
jgi:hypothetical protein